MRVFKNILIAVGLLVGAMALSIVINVANPPAPGSSGATTGVVWFVIVASSLWASISSNRLEFRRYKNSMAYHPVTIFLVHIMFWIVVFPWFLTIRGKIKDGTAELKDEFKPAISTPQVTPRPFFGSPVTTVTEVTEKTPSPVAQDLVPPPMPALKPRQVASVPAPLLLPPPLPPKSVQTTPDRLAQLQKLADFKAQGILSEEEFQSEKKRLLG